MALDNKNLFRLIPHFYFFSIIFRLKKLEFPSLNGALYKVWLRLVHLFWRRRWKCEKFTTTTTTTTNNGQILISSGELESKYSPQIILIIYFSDFKCLILDCEWIARCVERVERKHHKIKLAHYYLASSHYYQKSNSKHDLVEEYCWFKNKHKFQWKSFDIRHVKWRVTRMLPRQKHTVLVTNDVLGFGAGNIWTSFEFMGISSKIYEKSGPL